MKEKRATPVVCEDGRWFASIHDAARATGAMAQNIWHVCNGTRPRAAGLKFQYAEAPNGN